MAIDTAAKRASILGFGSGDLLPVPDGTIAVADRLTFLWLYGGIQPEEAPTPRVIYRPRTAPPPAAYRPISATLPPAYRPTNPSTPSG